MDTTRYTRAIMVNAITKYYLINFVSNLRIGHDGRRGYGRSRADELLIRPEIGGDHMVNAECAGLNENTGLSVRAVYDRIEM